jgi:pimeloyl-ACP methyl ester carboxylesterase
MVPPWKSTELADLIADARLTMLEGAPHAVNIEAAERFNQAVLGFLAGHAGSAASAATA